MNSVDQHNSTMSEIATQDGAVNAAIAERARQLRKAAIEMVRGAKRWDEKKNRFYDPESYITVDRIVSIMAAQDGCCYFYCGCEMLFGSDVNRSQNKDAVTLERVDSSLAHVADNCILACWSCNKAKGHNIPFDVMRLWAVPMKQKVVKWCNMCKTVKSVTQFGRDKSTSDGLNHRCRACNTIHCAQTRRNTRKRKLAQIEAASVDDETESQAE